MNENILQNCINILTFKILLSKSEKEKILLIADVYGIIELAHLKKYNINISPLMRHFINKEGKTSKKIINEQSEIFWNNYYSMFTTNKAICSLTDFLPNKKQKYQVLYQDEHNITDSIKIVNDFFYNYDKDVKKHFDYLNSNNLIQLADLSSNKYSGINFSFYSKNINYILISNINSINLPITLVHEVIHSYVNSFLQGINYDESFNININALGEVYSHFIELVFYEYLKEKNINKTDLNTFKLMENNMLISYLRRYNDNFPGISDMNEYQSSEIYAYGILLAVHYFNNYLHNPSITKDDILNMSIDSKKYNKHILLNNYGLSENKLNDHKVLTKFLSR